MTAIWTDDLTHMATPEVWMQEWQSSQPDSHASHADRFTARVNLLSRGLFVGGMAYCFWTGRIAAWIVWAFALVLIVAAHSELVGKVQSRDASEGFQSAASMLLRTQPMTQTPQSANPFGNPSPTDAPDRSPAPQYDEQTRDAIRAAAIDQMRGDPKQATLVALLDQGDPTAWYHFERMMYAFYSVPVTSVVNDAQDDLYASFRRSSPRIEAKERFVTRFVSGSTGTTAK
jgi:hypothetical protein